MTTNFKNYQKALKQKPKVIGDFEELEKRKPVSPVLEQILGQKPVGDVSGSADGSWKGKLDRLERRDKALSKQMVDQLEAEIEKYRLLREEKKRQEEEQKQVLLEQQKQAQKQPVLILTSPTSDKPKRGSAFLGLGKREKAAQMQIKKTRQEMAGGKGGD